MLKTNSFIKSNNKNTVDFFTEASQHKSQLLYECVPITDSMCKHFPQQCSTDYQLSEWFDE